MKGTYEEAVYSRFSKNAVDLRTRLGVSQQELALRSQMHRTQIDRLESKQRGIRLPGIVALAGGLAVPITALFDGISFEPATVSPGRFVVRSSEASEGGGGSQ